MDSSDLFLFGVKYTIPDTWVSDWDWVFARFSIVGWLYVVSIMRI